MAVPPDFPERELEMIGLFCSNTKRRIKAGDNVLIDGDVGQIEKVCLPGTQDAQDYSCFEDGGLLIKTGEFGLVLLPFGTFHEVKCLDKQDQ